MQRYAKVARAQQVANALPVGVLAFGAKCEPILAAAFTSGNFQTELLGWTP